MIKLSPILTNELQLGKQVLILSDSCCSASVLVYFKALVTAVGLGAATIECHITQEAGLTFASEHIEILRVAADVESMELPYSVYKPAQSLTSKDLFDLNVEV